VAVRHVSLPGTADAAPLSVKVDRIGHIFFIGSRKALSIFATISKTVHECEVQARPRRP
jgi:hypothetical protein